MIIEELQRKIIQDTTNNYVYICESQVGTSLNENKRRIYRINESGDKHFPIRPGTNVITDHFDFKPDDAENLTYFTG